MNDSQRRKSIWERMTEKQTFVGKYMTDLDSDRPTSEPDGATTKIVGMTYEDEYLTLKGEDFNWGAHRSVLAISETGLCAPAIGMRVKIADA